MQGRQSPALLFSRWTNPCAIEKEKRLTVLNIENKKTHVLPMSDLIADLLTAHRESVKGALVFPADGKGGIS